MAYTPQQLDAIDRVVNRQIENLETYQRARLSQTLRPLLGDDVGLAFSQARVLPLMETAINENVGLIRGLDQRQRDSIVQAIRREYDAPFFDKKQLAKIVEKQGGVTRSRAKLIARDQTSKVVNNLTQARHQEIGIRRYVWRGCW